MFDATSSPVAEAEVGVEFTETMRGYFSRAVKDDYEAAARQGRQDDVRCAFTLTITIDDVHRMVRDPAHEGRIEGTVTCADLAPAPLTVTEGRFNLFTTNVDEVMTRTMQYRMQLRAEDGRPYYFEGYKEVRDDRGFDLWSDTTTLYITIHEGDDAQGPVVGRGILKILVRDFARQLTTIRAVGARNQAEGLRAVATFGQFFAGALYDVYGGIFARATEFEPEAAPRRRRPLRMDAPEVHFFDTSDYVQLRLTRYQGGDKGPVLLVPGFGTSTLAFSIDTVDTNLPEFLYAHGYDVWLFDYRASPDLPSSRTPFTLDEIATRDYPAAVDLVRRLTGRDDVQVMAHCVGSMTLLMSLLNGLQGVRSAVCSQLTAHPVPPALNEFKAGARLASFLTVLGVDTLTTDYDPGNWRDRLYDTVLRLYPTQERCNSAICRRILFMYGDVYKHEQLNKATHEAIHEMFGVANMKTFEHLSRMMREGHLVDQEGRDVYMPHVARLNLPIAFLHGAENGLFLTQGSKLTYDWAREANGDALYTRHVIPEYAHMDCFMGRNAAEDVFPVILEELDKHN